MKPSYPLQHRLAGALLCFLGGFILLGWLLGSDMMVRIVPGSPAVAINTAIMFLLSGGCLLTAGKAGLVRIGYVSFAIMLIVLPLAILTQHIFHVDLGIDLAYVHAALGDGHAKPGRTAPNACLGFLSAGLVFVIDKDLCTGKGSKFSLVLASFTLGIGVLALLGYMLHLEMMYHLATFNKMAVLTALGITTLGIGLWSLACSTVDDNPAAVSTQARRITRLSATLLTVFAITAGLTGFAVLRHGFEASSTESLFNTAKTSAFIISSELKNALLVSGSVPDQASSKIGSALTQGSLLDPEVIQEFDDLGGTLIASGFSGIEIRTSVNQLVLKRGSLVTNKTLLLPLGEDPKAVLLWDKGLVLRLQQDVLENGRKVGDVITEWPLVEITSFMVSAQSVGHTNDLVLCGKLAEDLACFSGRSDESAIHLPMSGLGAGHAAAIAQVLRGQAGTQTIVDNNGALLQLAFAPLSQYGLAVIVKKEVIELYSPLRNRLHLLMAVLFVFVTIGTLLFRKWVQPLVDQLVSEQRRIKAILNNSNDAFIAIDSTGRVSDWNLQAQRTLGWSAKEALGQDLADLIIPMSQRAAHNMGFARFLTTGTGPVINQRVEVQALHKSGHSIPVELSVGSFHNGEGFGASAFIRDLTEIKAAERRSADQLVELEAVRSALVQSQKLEAVGKLTGGVAHDFNNVLQVVQGSLQLLQLENANSFRAEKQILTAMNAVDRGAKLSAQLLAFARKQPLQPKVISPASLIRNMGDMLQRALGDAIDIEVVAAGGLWNTSVDPSQLENVILNLSINARDAMAGQGKLTIEVSNATLDDEYVQAEPGLKAGQFVMLAISDTGPGMSQMVMERVFEPFFTTKPEGQGTGLGLSMAHGFVKQSEGHIRIYSELGHGTTIRIYLPRSLEPEVALTSQDTSKAVMEGGDETILVVEDDLAVQSTVVDLLSGLGYNVLKASNAELALEIIQKNRNIDLLFTDVVMPGALRSPELAKQAKQLIPQLEVLFTSGYTQNAIVHGGRLDPGVHLLSKPYGRDQLARKLRELLNSAKDQLPFAGPTESSTVPSNIKIAFVEDNEDFRAAVAQIMTMMGYNLNCFASAESALSDITNNAYDLLLTDVSLPGMSGSELASLATKIHPNLRVILASGYGTVSGVDFRFQLLPKPFSVDQLIACLKNSSL